MKLAFIKNKKIINSNLFFTFLLIVLSTILFIYIRNKLLFTPDFGQSDSYDFYISTHSFLKNHLVRNKIPFWTDHLQGGYPLFSEGQIEAFHIFNLILLKIFSFHVGYNLLFIIALFILSLGMYLLLREIKISSPIAFLISIIFAFNGAISLRFVHLDLIQTISIIPLLFFIYFKFLRTKQKIYIVVCCFLISQMIFAGHSQMVLIGIFSFVLWFTVIFFIKYKKFTVILKHILFLFTFIGVSFLISFPQILPTFTLTHYSSRTTQLAYESATSFPLQLKNLIGFFNPYGFGNPKLGTYPPFSSEWGIFWENTPYVGKIFFLFFIISCIGVFFIKDKKYKRFFIMNFSLFILFVLLALGKNSPLYFVFNFPPFSFFRVPSRYLIMAVFFMTLIVAPFVDHLYRKSNTIIKVVLIIVLLINVIDLISFTSQYHLFVDKDIVLSEPKLAKKIDSQYAYITFGQPGEWNKVFLTKGWKDKEAVNNYIFFKNYLYPNSNLLFGKKIYDIYAPLLLRRQSYLNSLLIDDVKLRDKNFVNRSAISSLFKLLGVKYVIISSPLKNKDLHQIDSVTQNGVTIRLFEIENIKNNMWYIPQKLIPITYLKDFEVQYEKIADLEKTAFIEDKKELTIAKKNNIRIAHQKVSEASVYLRAYFDNQTFFVFKKNWYPEWHAYVDRKETPIYKTNLVHIGIDIPKGNHTVELVYENRMFKYGVYISVTTLIIFLFVLKKKNLKFLKRLGE